MNTRQLILLAEALIEDEPFFDLVGELPGEPARMRTAINRAYYYAEHYARDALRALGFEDIAERKSHGEIWKCLQNCGQKDIEKVGRVLQELYRERLGADYKIRDAGFETRAKAQSGIEDASKIADTLSPCQDKTSAMATAAIEGMKKYRKVHG